MEPEKKQVEPEKPINLADERIARRTPFGPMSKFQSNPENRIVHESVKKPKD